jgi:hypothetical protein
MQPLPDDPDVDAILDADDPTLYRMWRHRALGATRGQALSTLNPKRSQILLKMPHVEYRIVDMVARSRGLSHYALVRQCIATHLIEDCAVEPEAIPYLNRYGVLP